jgi:hypothetical protein
MHRVTITHRPRRVRRKSAAAPAPRITAGRTQSAALDRPRDPSRHHPTSKYYLPTELCPRQRTHPRLLIYEEQRDHAEQAADGDPRDVRHSARPPDWRQSFLQLRQVRTPQPQLLGRGFDVAAQPCGIVGQPRARPTYVTEGVACGAWRL